MANASPPHVLACEVCSRPEAYDEAHMTLIRLASEFQNYASANLNDTIVSCLELKLRELASTMAVVRLSLIK